ncbi:7TM diverse intracellular signaling domain-containing protein [Alkalimarinus alittae]|uniref:histidine kinase n=1 Tax=Alkalimarinus alittae TaxID=2961619 RepID=A0ABY6MZV4_9ALTE|nr:7TM diverse intracellular signaling domain-containing protein [Alkalimarinus alittae]UZE95378.1 ATP-binding protein [Alkalimarinus alittae]
MQTRLLEFCQARLSSYLSILFFSLTLLLSSSGVMLAYGSTSIKLQDHTELERIGSKVLFLKDSEGHLTIDEIMQGTVDDKFFQVDNNHANFGFDKSVYWIKFSVQYRSKKSVLPKDWWLEFEYQMLDRVDAYIVSSDGSIIKRQSGDLRRFENNPFDFPHALFHVPLLPQETKTVYIRVDSDSSIQLGLNVWSTKGLIDHISEERLHQGIFIGIMLIMLFYNLFVYFSIKDIAYLYYVLAIAAFVVGQSALNGLVWQYVDWKDLTWNNTVMPFTLNIIWSFLMLFSRSFLQTKQRAPMIDAIIKFCIVASIWLAVISLMTDYNFSIQLSTRVTIVYAIVLSITGIVLWRRGHRAARYYTFSWVGYMVGVLSSMLYLFGVLPHNYFTSNGIQLGAFVNVLLLSLALADRINTQKRQTEVARRKALIAQKQAVDANKRALANLNKFKMLYENASESIFQCTLDGRFMSANPALANIFGYSTADEIIANVENIATDCCVDPKEREKFEALILVNGRVRAFESEYKRRDGSLFWGSSSVRLVKNEKGEPAYFEGSLIDITERVERERAERDREAAQASTSAKSEFLANMSHEIRTPMNAIIGFSTLAQKTDLTVKQRDYINKIENSSKSLLGIINDILDFSKIEAGKLDLECVPFDIYDVVNDLVTLLSHRAADKNLELVVNASHGVPSGLIGDSLRLEQILVNLTNNAIKFTAEGEVVVRISEVQSLDDKVLLQFSVRDTGIGLNKSQQQKLFKPFSQADGSTTRQYGGTGLGLSISKQLVEMMGGEIWVESKEGEGSTFAFNAWFDTQKEKTYEDIYSSKELNELSVLLVDDKDAGQEAMLEILSSFKCKAHWIQPDYTLIDKQISEIKYQSFDLVIIDRQLNAMRSMDAAIGIRSISEFTEVPIMVMALSNEEDLIEDAENHHFHPMIKPVTPSLLLDTIQEILGYTGPKHSKRLALEEGEKQLVLLRGHKVLLVEDTLFNQEIATEFLRQVDIDVALVNNGQEAVDFLSDSNNVATISCVLMDVQMPIMDGFEATRRIRNQLGLKDLPVIAMTANAMKGDKQKCLNAGMDDYISKPVAQDVLFGKLLKWIAPNAPELEQDPAQAQAEQALNQPGENHAIDLTKALEQMGGNREMLNRMLVKFKDEHHEAVAEIINAYDTEDFALAHRLAHSLKGMAASIAAEDLRTHAAELEEAIERGALSTHVEKMFFNTENALVETINYIAQLEEVEL